MARALAGTSRVDKATVTTSYPLDKKSHTFCTRSVFELHPALHPLSTRSVPSSAKREERFSSDCDSTGIRPRSTPESTNKKHRKMNPKINITILESLTTSSETKLEELKEKTLIQWKPK